MEVAPLGRHRRGQNKTITRKKIHTSSFELPADRQGTFFKRPTERGVIKRCVEVLVRPGKDTIKEERPIGQGRPTKGIPHRLKFILERQEGSVVAQLPKRTQKNSALTAQGAFWEPIEKEVRN